MWDSSARYSRPLQFFTDLEIWNNFSKESGEYHCFNWVKKKKQKKQTEIKIKKEKSNTALTISKNFKGITRGRV